MLKRVSAMDMRHSLGQMLNEVSLRNDQIIIERNGKPLAALVPVWFLTNCLKNRNELKAIMNQARANAGGLTEEELQEEILSSIHEVRRS